MELFVVALVLSVLGLIVGPLIVALGRNGRGGTDLIDGLVVGVVPVLVAARILPHLYEEIGPAAPALACVGYAVIGWLEGRQGPSTNGGSSRAATLASAMVLPALAVHSLFDGVALALAFAQRGNVGAIVLGGALVAHRLPEGLFLGSVFVPRVGVRGALFRVAWLAASTLAGAALGQAVFLRAPEKWLHAFVALGLGAMVHLVLHRHEREKAEPGAAAGRASAHTGFGPGAVGFAVGVVLALRMPFANDPLSRARALIGLAAACLSAAALVRSASHGEWSFSRKAEAKRSQSE